MKSYDDPTIGIEDNNPFILGFTSKKVKAKVVTNKYQKNIDTTRLITLLLFRLYVDDEDRNQELIITNTLTAIMHISS